MSGGGFLMDNIILYSTHCPKCNILEKKLKDKNIHYEEINDVDDMLNKGITEVPILYINGENYSFGEAVKYINSI